MPSPLEHLFDLESTVGADFQTRIPEAVCRALRLKPNDRMRYRIDNDGRVHLENMSLPATVARGESPPLLGLIAGLMAGGQDTTQKLDSGLMSSLQDLMNNTPSPAKQPAKPRDSSK